MTHCPRSRWRCVLSFWGKGGCSSMVELLLPKQIAWVRFPSPAPSQPGGWYGRMSRRMRCRLRSMARLAPRPVVRCPPCCREDTDTYCEGSRSRTVAQSPVPAATPDSIHQRESNGGQTGYGESRPKNSRNRQRDLGNSSKKMARCHAAWQQAVSTCATTSHIHPQSKWRETSSGHPDHARPGDASAASIGA